MSPHHEHRLSDHLDWFDPIYQVLHRPVLHPLPSQAVKNTIATLKKPTMQTFLQPLRIHQANLTVCHAQVPVVPTIVPCTLIPQTDHIRHPISRAWDPHYHPVRRGSPLVHGIEVPAPVPSFLLLLYRVQHVIAVQLGNTRPRREIWFRNVLGLD